ncbi:hemerythrin domain-containing protein [Piscinibacter sakaiensis]|uniref:hemerythrin domain-containing protein n=1 Tax=Piscinibacter sakaiensis TaxID=1547922 RepID=UPI003AAF2E6C
MTTDFPGHAAAPAGFEVPLEMLAACHLRIERQYDTLLRLAPHLREHGSDQQARDAAAAVLRYFDSAAAHHHEDEENDLFPALLEAMAGSDAVCIREMIGALLAEHRVLEGRWQRLRPQLLRIAEGAAGLLDDAEIAAFADGYRSHIEREENELLPMAGRLLDAAQLERIGRSMRLRRGIDDAAVQGGNAEVAK